MPAPFTPQDFLEVIPGPASPFCEAFLREFLQQGASLDRALAAYLLNESGDLTDTAFADDLCALDCAGAGTGNGTDPGTQPPGSGGDPTIPVPSNIRASDGDYPDRVLVEWDAVTSAVGFEIWRNTSNTLASATKIGTVNSPTTLSFADVNVEIDKSYWYWLRTLTAANVSLFSTPDTGYAVMEFTAIVTDLEASQGWGPGLSVSTIFLAFTKVAGADGYSIYRSATNDFATATLIDRNRIPFDNSQSFLLSPAGENPVKPTFHDGGDYVCYADSLPLADRFKVWYYWVVPKKVVAGQATAVGQANNTAATGWDAGDGSANVVLSTDSLQLGHLSTTVPGGATKAWLAFIGSPGNGAGGGDVNAGGGGGGSAFASVLLPVDAGKTLAIVYTPATIPARAVQLTNGSDGALAELSYDSSVILTITSGLGGVYNGAGGAAGGVSVNTVSATTKPGRDGVAAATATGGRSGAPKFGFRVAGAHYPPTRSWEGDGATGGGGSWAIPGASSSATGGRILGFGVVRIIFYS